MVARAFVYFCAVLGLASSAFAVAPGHCVGRLSLDEFEMFMLNATSQTESDDIALLEVDQRLVHSHRVGGGSGSGSGSGSGKPTQFVRSVPRGGLSTLQLCVDIQVPVTPGIKAQVVLDGMMQTGKGPLTHNFFVTAKVAGVFGWSFMTAAVEVKGKVSLEATDCESWGQVLKVWTAGILEDALHTDEVQKMAKNAAQKKEIADSLTKIEKALKNVRAKFAAAKKAGDKVEMMKSAVGVKLLKDMRSYSIERLDGTPGVCALTWSAGVTVGGSAGGTEGCGSFPWVMIEAGYSWTQDIVGGLVSNNNQVAGGVVKITPICETLYCFQVVVSYDTTGSMQLSTNFYLPADTSLQGSFPKMILDIVNGAKSEVDFSEALGKHMVGMKNVFKGGLLKAVKIAGEGQVDGALVAANKGIGGPGGSLIAAMIFKTIDALWDAATAPGKELKGGADGAKQTALSLVKDFFAALGKNVVDMLKGSKQDFKEFLLKSVGVKIQDNLGFEFKYEYNHKKKEKRLSGTIQALKVMSLPGKDLFRGVDFKIDGVYLQGRSFDLFGSPDMYTNVWEKLKPGSKKSHFRAQRPAALEANN